MTDMTDKVIIPEFTELTFEDAPHIYRLNGLEIPSVTTLMKPLSNEVYGTVDEAVLNRAAQRGTDVHETIETLVKYGIEDCTTENRGYLEAFKAWMKDHQVEPVASECRLYHKVLRYAGTADLPSMIGGKLTMVDVKTTASLIEMLARVQLEAYVQGYASHGIAFEQKAILHLKRDGSYKMEMFSIKDPEAWTVFGALLTVNNYLQRSVSK